MIDEILAQQFLDYCEDQQNLSPNTIVAYRQDLKSFMLFHQSTLESADTERETVLRYLRFLRKAKSLHPSTIQRRIATLRMCVKWIRRYEFGAPSPFDELHLTFRKPKLTPRAIDTCVLRQLLNEDDHNVQMLKHSYSEADITLLVLRILIMTGLRIGELTGLNIKDVHSQDTKIRVLGKGSRERIVYIANDELHAEFVQFLQWRRANDKPSAHLFPNRCGERLTPPAFRKRLKLLCEAKNIAPHVTPHQFRHSAATLLIENGVDIRMVQRLLGHASIATTEIYTRVSDQALEATLVRADVLTHLEPKRSKDANLHMLVPKGVIAASWTNSVESCRVPSAQHADCSS